MNFQDCQIICIGYLLVINLYAFLLYGFDKYCAIKAYNRVSERSLLISALVFGSMGAMLGMVFFRHKIRKKKFRYLIPFFLALQIALVYLHYKNANISFFCEILFTNI